MTTSADVREELREAEDFLRGGDPYGATARVRLAARKAATMSAHDGAEVRQAVALAVDRFGPAEQAAREEVEQRHALHVANERVAAGMSAEETPSPPRRSWMAGLIGRIARLGTRQTAPRALEV